LSSHIGEDSKQLHQKGRSAPGLAGKDCRIGGASESHGEHWRGWQAPGGVDCLFGQLNCPLLVAC
jgi:hypothetical protein